MVGSGPTAISTSGGPVQIIPNQAQAFFLNGYLCNGGSVAGQYSVDGGATWQYLPANVSVPLFRGAYSLRLMVQPSGSDLTGISAALA